MPKGSVIQSSSGIVAVQIRADIDRVVIVDELEVVVWKGVVEGKYNVERAMKRRRAGAGDGSIRRDKTM